MDFETIPGVGAKTAAALADLDDAEGALRAGDVATIAQAPGISPARAARIARAAIRHRHDDTTQFLATEQASRLSRTLLDRLKERAVTDYATHRLETLYPTNCESRIEEVQAMSRRALERAPAPAITERLSAVKPIRVPRPPRIRDRCLVTGDADQYGEAREAYPELSVELADDARTLADLARGYSTVIVIDERLADVTVDADRDGAGQVEYRSDPFDDPTRIVPERILAFFDANRKSIQAAIDIHRKINLESPCDVSSLESALDRIGSDGAIVGDAEIERLTRASTDLDEVIVAAERLATDRLRETIDERPVTIDGADLLSLVERGAGVDSILDQELRDEFAEAVAEAREHVIETLSLTPDEAGFVREAFPEDPTFPVTHRTKPIDRLRERLEADRDQLVIREKEDLATTLAEYRADASTLVTNALELDVEFAIADFCREYDCTMPTFTDSGIEIEGGRSPILEESPEQIEPVSYSVSGVTLLTGVNSGGKTATLDLVGAIVILAHMGLPVPADRVRLARFEALHYHAKGSGTLDAGAFESTLREFADIVDGDPGALVLVDELESITEPGAAATIMAGILEMLTERSMTAIFVSHLADQILEATDAPITVDGIEARGIVDGRLKVDRSPVRDHLARSTPELIVEKLATEHGSPVYERLLEKF